MNQVISDPYRQHKLRINSLPLWFDPKFLEIACNKHVASVNKQNCELYIFTRIATSNQLKQESQQKGCEY